MSSALPAPSQQASKAALTAALTENPHSNTLEPGEIQEIDMQAQAEGIRTVFSDPTNFNVKVHLSHFATLGTHPLDISTPSTLPGRSGSIHPQQRVETSLRHPSPLSLRPLYLRLPVQQQRKVGWRTLNV